METRELFGFFVAIILALLLAFCIAAVIHVIIGDNYCDVMAELYRDSYQFHWSLWTGCLVQAPSGRWVNAREYFRLEGILDGVIGNE